MSEIDRFDTLFGPMFHTSDDEVIGQSLRRYGQWAIDEIALIAHVMRKGAPRDFIDLGANVGTHTIAVASLFPHSEVFSFEANARTFQLLCANVTGNGLTNANVFNYLVGDVTAMTRVVTNEADIGPNLGAVAFRPVPMGDASGRLMLQAAVDDIYPATGTAAFVKADLVGMELPALRGARATLQRCCPAIYFDNGSQLYEGPLFEMLAELGYDSYWHINFPFDEDNFRGELNNFFGHSVEIGTLCIHSDNPMAAEFRRSLTPTHQTMDETAWQQCVSLNIRLRADLRAGLTPGGGQADWLRTRLLQAMREANGAASSANDPPGAKALPSFAEIRRATLLDIPGDALRPLLAPYVAAAPLDEVAYLRRNPDVAQAVAAQLFRSAREHYVQMGYFEGRTS